MLSASVIGCGFGGGLSLDGLNNSPDYEILAVADPSAAALEMLGRFPSARRFSNYRDMLAECPADVVCVATPAPTHASISRDVLRNGVRGMLIEKPLDCDFATAEALLTQVKSGRCPVVVPHGMLVLPAAQEVKARIRQGDIGEIESVVVQNAVDLLNGGIHWIVYLLDVFETDRPALVKASFDLSGRVVNDGVQVETGGLTSVSLSSGLTIDFHSGKKTVPRSDVLPKEEQRGALFRIAGSRGVVEFSAWAGSYWIKTASSGDELIRRPLADGLTYHRIFLDQLARDIHEGRPRYRSAELSLEASRVIETAYGQSDDDDWALGKPAAARP